MTHGPTEPRDGQDGPPNTLAVLVVVLRLLDDVHDHLADEDHRQDLLLRLVATRRVVRRLRDQSA